VFCFWRLRQPIPQHDHSEAIKPISWFSSIFIVLASVLHGSSALEAQILNHGSKPMTGQRAELVFDRRCMEAIDPLTGFELHVPLDDKGEPVEKEIYSTGGLNFKIKDPECGIVQVGPATTRKDTAVDSRERLSCNPGR
jgi:hypothetical protein